MGNSAATTPGLCLAGSWEMAAAVESAVLLGKEVAFQHVLPGTPALGHGFDHAAVLCSQVVSKMGQVVVEGINIKVRL